MGCPPVCGDNPRALASGLSYVQVDKHGITIYTTIISVDHANHEMFHAKVGKGGINDVNKCRLTNCATKYSCVKLRHFCSVFPDVIVLQQCGKK